MSKSVNIAIIKYIYFVIFILYNYEINAQQQFHSHSVTITMKGTSNIHNWSSETNQGFIDMSANIDAGLWNSISALNATILAKTIKSSKGAVMDKHMHNALKADAYPEIVYTLEKVNEIQSSGKQYTLSTTGRLKIAGITRRIDISISAFLYTPKSISIRFSKKIKMSDYNIKPPIALFGLIRTGDEVELLFDCMVAGE